MRWKNQNIFSRFHDFVWRMILKRTARTSDICKHGAKVSSSFILPYGSLFFFRGMQWKWQQQNGSYWCVAKRKYKNEDIIVGSAGSSPTVQVMGLGKGVGGGSGGGGVFNGLFWLLILIFVSWWVATICFPFYVLFSIFTPCVSGLKNVTDILLSGVSFPHKCSDNMVHKRSYDSI